MEVTMAEMQPIDQEQQQLSMKYAQLMAELRTLAGDGLTAQEIRESTVAAGNAFHAAWQEAKRKPDYTQHWRSAKFRNLEEQETWLATAQAGSYRRSANGELEIDLLALKNNQLPLAWASENTASAKYAVEQFALFSTAEYATSMRAMAERVHDQWMVRNFATKLGFIHDIATAFPGGETALQNAINDINASISDTDYISATKKMREFFDIFTINSIDVANKETFLEMQMQFKPYQELPTDQQILDDKLVATALEQTIQVVRDKRTTGVFDGGNTPRS